MSDQAALLAAIIAHPDDDTPRLMYADWLDENLPDKVPSPAAGPSARAEYIRVQCRLAGLPFDDPDYPELLEREQDLAAWLRAHTPEEEARPDLAEDFDWYGEFDHGHGRNYARGFPDEFEYSEYEDEPEENISRIVEELPGVFERTTLRTLRLENAYGAEITGITANRCVANLRGLVLCDIDDDNDAEAARAVASSKHLANLRYLELDISLDSDSLKRLARATNLSNLESLRLDYQVSDDLGVLAGAKWLRNLRALELWLPDRNSLKELAGLPMPNLVSLTVSGSTAPTATAMRKFAASDSFPRLARLEFSNTTLNPELVALLAAGKWPLRHLNLAGVSVQKVGAAALAKAPFAETLRVLELHECGITAGGVQALAQSEALAGLRHLDLSDNRVGVSGLAAIARSEHLRGLRKLRLDECNSTKAPIDAAAMFKFLSALEMPELRHLELDWLPVGVRGAGVLASRACFANLTRLSLVSCGLREKGARAIVESSSLANLTDLGLPGNNAGKGVAKLADRKVLPRLGSANVCNNRIPKSTLNRLARRPAVQV